MPRPSWQMDADIHRAGARRRLMPVDVLSGTETPAAFDAFHQTYSFTVQSACRSRFLVSAFLLCRMRGQRVHQRGRQAIVGSEVKRLQALPNRGHSRR